MIAGGKRKGHGNRAQAKRDRGISGEAGIGIEDFVAGIEQGHHREEESDLAAGREYDVGWRNLDVASARQVGGDFLAQGGDASDGAVPVLTVTPALRASPPPAPG